MKRVFPVVGVFSSVVLLWLCSCRGPAAERAAGGAASEQFDETNPLGANGACYVCHMAFVSEELSKSHLKAKVACTGCHGLSAGHANDEDIGATAPDRRFSRVQVDAMCLACHERCKTVTGAAAIVCTDCHGEHRIRKSAAEAGS